MGPIDSLNHWLNFAAPAFAVAAMLPAFARWLVAPQAAVPAFGVQLAINFAAGLAVSLAGLWFWGQDGKMSTYALMLLVCASSQWLLQRGWKA